MRHTQSFQNLNQQPGSLNSSSFSPTKTDRGGQAQSQNRNPALYNTPVAGAHVMSNEQKKVLEEIQKTKTLLKQGAAASLGIPFPSSVPVGSPNNHFAPAGPFNNDVHISPLQRTAMQTLQQANATSFGSFVSTDSHFGNGILPVLPRLPDPNNKTDLKPSS